MAEIRDDVVLDFQQAIREINRVERLFDEAFGQPIDVDFDVQSGLRSARAQMAQLDEIDIPVDLDTTEARQEVNRLEQQFDQLSLFDAVNEADRLADELDQAEREAAQLEAETAGIAGELRDAEAEAEDLGRELDQAGRRGSSIGQIGANIGLVAAGAAAAIGLVRGLGEAFRFAGQSIQAASNLEESISKVGVVFGEFSDEVEAFAQTGPRALGLANAEALEFAGTFGNLFVSMGLGQEAAADMSAEIVQLGADLASFNNIEVDEALIKLRAGLVGEFEALRTVGVALNAAVVEQKAFELGLADANGELTEAAKIQARYALILEQTGTAQGDFARTADGIANTQRTLRAEFENIRAEIGQALLPAYSALLDLAPAVLGVIEDTVPVIRALTVNAAEAAPAVLDLADALQAVALVPGAIGDLGSILGGIGEVAIGSLQFLTDFEAGAERTNRGIERIGQTIDNINVSRLQTELVDALQAGIDPAVALANVLVALTDQGLDLDQIQETANAFGQIAGISPQRMLDVAAAIRAQGTAIGLEADEVQALNAGLFLLENRQRQVEAAQQGSEQRSRQNALDRRAAVDATRGEIDALTELQIAADAAGLSLSGFASENVDTVDSIIAMADPLERARIEMALTAEEAAELASELQARLGGTADFPLFDDLPEQIGVVTGQVEDETGKLIDVISTSADDILAQIRRQNEAQASFEANIVRLALAGAPRLAERLREEGPAAAAAAQDFLANVGTALEAEDELRGAADTQAAAIADQLGTELANLDMTDPATEMILGLARDLTNPAILAVLDQAADVALARYRNRFLDQITGSGGVDFAATPPTSITTGRIGGVDAGAMNVTVNMDNFRATDPTGAAQRAGATAATVAGQVRGYLE